jgi:membrane protein implicated in regulation of membrane protease activity
LSALQWILVAIVAGAVEIVSAGFWFMWLALSALLVAAAAGLGLLKSLELQLIVFSLLTLIFIVFTRPLVLKFIKTNDTISNVKALIGQHGIVITGVAPLQNGQVKVNGEIWSAASEETIEPDQRVEVIGIDGVKLLVKSVPPQA